MIEVTVYAIVALFIFFRLYLALGKQSDSEKFSGAEKIIDVLEEKDVIEDTFAYVNKDNFDKIHNEVMIIKKGKSNFSTDSFARGAERAFETIISAFYDHDLKTLANLLDDKVLHKFVNEIEKRKKDKKTHKNMIVAISSKEILDVSVIKNDVFISIKFISEQMHIVDDVASDDKTNSTKTKKIEDVWKFTQKMSSTNPKWLLCEISS